jgi:hypothetical protein
MNNVIVWTKVKNKKFKPNKRGIIPKKLIFRSFWPSYSGYPCIGEL